MPPSPSFPPSSAAQARVTGWTGFRDLPVAFSDGERALPSAWEEEELGIDGKRRQLRQVSSGQRQPHPKAIQTAATHAQHGPRLGKRGAGRCQKIKREGQDHNWDPGGHRSEGQSCSVRRVHFCPFHPELPKSNRPDSTQSKCESQGKRKPSTCLTTTSEGQIISFTRPVINFHGTPKDCL